MSPNFTTGRLVIQWIKADAAIVAESRFKILVQKLEAQIEAFNKHFKTCESEQDLPK